MIRLPAHAGSFYPRDSIELKRTVTELMKAADAEESDSLGAVVPHAGYAYSGLCAAHVYKSMPGRKGATFIILGTDHSGLSTGASVASSGIWRTPLGGVKIDSAVAKKLLASNGLFKDEAEAHEQEHSVEVQLPFLQCRFDNVKIVPVVISSAMDLQMCTEIAGSVADAGCYVIASSDLTHYGAGYGYAPFPGGRMDVLAQMRKLDMKIIGAIKDLDARSFVETIKNTGNTTCGVAPVATLMKAMRRMGARTGRLLKYATSYDVTKDVSSIVGYAGITFS